MPIQPTYPGVYIEEIPSGVHTITGVATSITAFIGRALRGPTDTARTINSYADYERIFGGLWLDSAMSYAVRDFFLNGGSQAVIVRLFNADQAGQAAANQAVQAVVNITDPTKPSTPQSLAAAMNTQAATYTTEPAKTSAALVAAAALKEAGSPASVKAAAQQAADAITAAVQAVVDVKDPNSPSTPQSLYNTMNTQAGTYSTDPEKTAAGLVAAAAKSESDKKNSTVDSVKNAAQTAATAITTAMQAVVDANDTTNPQTSQSLADAMNKQAGTYTTDPEKTAAGLVATAAQNEATRATIASVKNAAQTATNTAVPATKTKFSPGGLPLVAANEGSWGQYLRASIDRNNIAKAQDTATRLGLTTGDLFNLTVSDSSPGGATEKYYNLSLKDSMNRIDKVLTAQSSLMQWDSDTLDLATNPPPAMPTLGSDGYVYDPVTQAQNDYKIAVNNQRQAPPTQRIDPNSSVNQAVSTAKASLVAAMDAFVATDGIELTMNDDFLPSNAEVQKRGLYALEQVDLYNLLCIPPYQNFDVGSGGDVEPGLIPFAAEYCEQRRAVLLIDPPSSWSWKPEGTTTPIVIDDVINKFSAGEDVDVGASGSYAATFFPRLRYPNQLRNNQMETFAPCGAIAGIFARTDTERGVWKAPAGIDATLNGVPELSVNLTDAENGQLNPLGLNCLRAFPIYGRVVWGSRTMRGADQLADDYKYIPVRRTALFIEESLYRGTKWAVFEPNDEPLWSQLRLNIGVFMHDLFRKGAFQGQTPKDAYFVKCDHETTTQSDINLGIVNVVVGFAPLKPAEFVIIQIQQMTGQLEV
jgi:Bacteriophage tail sheath protein